jgi:hypothetical protein
MEHCQRVGITEAVEGGAIIPREGAEEISCQRMEHRGMPVFGG